MGQARFFAADLSGSPIVLVGAEAAHLRDARRLRVGQTVTLFDGQGGQVSAEIARLDRNQAELLPLRRERVRRPVPVVLTVATAVCKGSRQDWLIEKCTELGVAEFIPLLANRSVVRPSAERIKRWHRLCIESAKQSGQAWVPYISPPQTLQEVLAEIGLFARAWLADPASADVSLSQAVSGLSEPPDSAILLIGPEGGFDEAELAAARQAGVRIVRLGRTILRVETAAVAAAAMVLLREAKGPAAASRPGGGGRERSTEGI
jgi:16S rRNA (uracil1498-N3)-methyltransferase